MPDTPIYDQLLAETMAQPVCPACRDLALTITQVADQAVDQVAPLFDCVVPGGSDMFRTVCKDVPAAVWAWEALTALEHR